MQDTLPHFIALTNRAADDKAARFALPADGFVQLVPLGRAPNVRSDGSKIIQLVDEAAVTAMLNKLVEQGGEMLIDFEHFSRDPEKATDAAAWLPLTSDTLQNRGKDGLWGKPRWSEGGEEAVTGGRLRHISPEFPDSNAALQNVSGNIFRPLALIGAGLTNRPNFRTGKALTNRGAESDPSSINSTSNTMKALVAGLLGITEPALDALNEDALKNRFSDITKKLNRCDTLEAEVLANTNREIDAVLVEYKGIAPEKADDVKTFRDLYLANRAGADLIIGGWKAAKAAKADGTKTDADKKPLFNKEKAGNPPAQDAEAEVRALHNRAAQIRKERGGSYDNALAAARAEQRD